jgi:outer membrane protein TolC
MNKLLLLLWLVAATPALAQRTETLSLADVIGMAQQKSPAYARARNTFENNYWRYKNYRASMLPALNLNGTLPNINRSIERITLPDGSDAFVDRSLATSSAVLSIDQNLPLTGGRFSVLSGLQRIDLFGAVNGTSFLSTPISISYFQNNVFYNDFRWQRRIEPLVFEEARRAYAEQMEDIALQATNLFFELLAAENNFRLAEINLANTDTLYKISKGRFDLGKIAENDLLQIELSLLNARNRVAETGLELELRQQDLRRFLSIPDAYTLQLTVPENTRFFEVSPEKALEESRNNRQAVLQFRRRRLEAEQQVARMRGENGVQLGISANFGLTQRGTVLGSVYTNPQDQQTVALTLNVPLVNWGLNKSRIRMAEANRELNEVNVQQDEINFEQEIRLQVMRFAILRDQLLVAAKADTIAQKRFEVTKERYLIGKISITDLNLSIQEKDQARQAYIQMLRTYWNNYYLLRRLTLYDFERAQKISPRSAELR